jgi:hypothetical protein
MCTLQVERYSVPCKNVTSTYAKAFSLTVALSSKISKKTRYYFKPNHMGNGIQPAIAPSDKVDKKKKTHKKILKYSLSETSKGIFIAR